ncbi:MAG: SGNH/GDSL hydrolase family protein [Bacteroidota bacterium]
MKGIEPLAIICKATFSITIIFCPVVSHAEHNNEGEAIIVIGSSYVNGTTRIDDNFFGALNGLAVGSGAYLSLGDALVRDGKLNGLVVNEGAVGSTTFDRKSCLMYECLPGGRMLGFMSQFKNALKRVAIYDPMNPMTVAGYNASYAIIDIPNDCIHSDAFGQPQIVAMPCGIKDFEKSVDRIVKVINYAKYLGITPIVTLLPKYKDLNLSLVKRGLQLYWVIDEYSYTQFREIYQARIAENSEGAIILDVWGERFTHRGDGIHPDRKTVREAASRIANIINKRVFVKECG